MGQEQGVGVGTGKQSGVEHPGRPVIVCEKGFSMNLFRTVDSGYADSNIPAAHLPIWKERYPEMFIELKALYNPGDSCSTRRCFTFKGTCRSMDQG
jgi:hypothetical protein